MFCLFFVVLCYLLIDKRTEHREKETFFFLFFDQVRESWRCRAMSDRPKFSFCLHNYLVMKSSSDNFKKQKKNAFAADSSFYLLPHPCCLNKSWSFFKKIFSFSPLKKRRKTERDDVWSHTHRRKPWELMVSLSYFTGQQHTYILDCVPCIAGRQHL